MMRCILILLTALFSTALAKYYIQELKPSSGNVQDIKQYSYALSLLNNFISTLESQKQYKLTQKEDIKSNQKPRKATLESVEDLTRSQGAVNVLDEEIEPSDLVPYKNFSPVVKESGEIELHELVPVRTLSPVKVYSDEIDELNLSPPKLSAIKIEPSNLVPVRMGIPEAHDREIKPLEAEIVEASIEIKKIQPDTVLRALKKYLNSDTFERKDRSDLVPTRSIDIGSDEMQQSNSREVKEIHLSNLVPTKLRSLNVEDHEMQSSGEIKEIHPSNLVPTIRFASEDDEMQSSSEIKEIHVSDLEPTRLRSVDKEEMRKYMQEGYPSGLP